MTNLLQDLRYALRQLRRAPGFTLTVIAILGLGVALNAAIFTVVDCVLLRPLGYRDADRIVTLKSCLNDRNRSIELLGGLDYNDLAAQVKGLESTAYFNAGMGGLQVNGQAQYLRVAGVSPRFTEVMGVQPIAGRLFNPSDTKGTGGLVSARFAREHFGSVQAALGKPLQNESGAYTVVGVLPDGFSFPYNSSVWLERDALATSQRSSYSQHAIGKRRAGVSDAQLNAELVNLSQQLQKAYPEDKNKSLESVPLQESITGNIRPTLRLLMGSVFVLLLIVCANVTHLQLVRATRQARLITIQTALGASRARLAANALTEAALLGIGGCIVALLIAQPALRLLIHLAPPDVPRLEDIHLNTDVLLFSLLLSLLVMTVTAILPVWRSWHLDPATALRQDSSRGLESRSTSRLRSSFLVVQVALTLTLSVAAVLLARQLIAQSKQDLGFEPVHLITLDTQTLAAYTPSGPPKPNASPAEILAQQQKEEAAKVANVARMNAALDTLRTIPGVLSAEATTGAPMGFNRSSVGYAIKGRTVFAPPYEHLANANIHPVTPGLLAGMHVPLLQGRSLSADDRSTTPRVLLINRELARQEFPNQDPIGKQIMCGYDSEGEWWTIVGVVGDTINAPGASPGPTFYVPVAQHGDAASEMQFVVRTQDPTLTPDTLQRHLQQAHPDIAVKATTMAQNFTEMQRTSVFRSLLFGGFAAVSILLSAAGMYGVMAYSVAQRQFEFGLRFALAAQRSQVLGMVLRRALIVTAIGLTIGTALSLALTRVFNSTVNGTTGTAAKPPAFDIAAYLIAIAAVLLLTMLATLLPANRAAHIDPNQALRSE